MSSTEQQYKEIINNCRDLFEKKTKDYGTAWRILRTSSLTDQIFIKAQRIRTIQETGENRVGEAIENEFVGIINYCIMAQLQIELPGDSNLEIIAVLENLKLPFNVQQTIHINKFNVDDITINKNKTYIMVCQRGLNSYIATERLKKKYPNLKVFSLTDGISSYK